MRQIEFRAWDVKTHKMIEFGPLYGLQSVIDKGRHANSGYKIMQFTGLFDKHGKKIFEGDILHNRDYFFARGIVESRENKFVPVVYNGGYLTSDDWWETAEVIGNVFENPELVQP